MTKKNIPSQKVAKDYFVDLCKENNKKYYVNMFIRKLKQGIVKN